MKKCTDKKMFLYSGIVAAIVLAAILAGFCFWKFHFHHEKAVKRTIGECQNFVKNKQNDEAVACYQNVIGNDPNNLSAKAELANIYMSQKKYDDSTRLYNEVSQANPNNTFVLNSLANSLRDSGKTDEAVKSYQTAIDKGNIDSVINLVTIYNTTGQFDKSITLLDTQLKINPKDSTLTSLLASTYSKSGNQKKAQSLIDSTK